MLSKLTIVIPSFERQHYLERQVNYWKDKRVKIIILDGSKCSWEYVFSYENVKYFHIPETIEKRLLFAASRIDTEYSALLSDDEFFLPSALESCILQLDNNVDAVSCKGAALGFNYLGKDVVGFDVYPTLRNIFSINQSTSQERMLRHMRPYNMTTLWAVIRRDVFIATLKAMGSDGPFKSAATGELQTSLLVSYYGKCLIIDELMWLRSSENKNIWWQAGPLSIVDWYKDANNKHEIELFFNNIQAQIEFNDKSILMKWLLDAMNSYVDGCLSKPKRRKQIYIRFIKDVVKNILMQLPENIYSYILQYGRKPPIKLSDAAIILNKSNVKVDFSEVSIIESIISEFHSNKHFHCSEL